MSIELSGFSTPWVGISWNSVIKEKDRIKYLFLYLSSKRILVNPISMEIKEQCIESVLEIKRNLVEVTKDIKFSEKNLTEIQKMLSACNAYLDAVNSMKLPHILYKNEGEWSDVEFNSAMKNFRCSFKESILAIENNTKIKSNIDIPEKW